MTDSEKNTNVTSDMDYLTKLMDEADIDGGPLLNLVDTSRRQYFRKPCFMAVDYAVNDLVHKGFITNVSANGVFIEAPRPMAAGQDITMTFSSPAHEFPVKITGRIVHNISAGIGVAVLTTNQRLRSTLESLT